jgi:hypothetical protein
MYTHNFLQLTIIASKAWNCVGKVASSIKSLSDDSQADEGITYVQALGSSKDKLGFMTEQLQKVVSVLLKLFEVL